MSSETSKEKPSPDDAGEEHEPWGSKDAAGTSDREDAITRSRSSSSSSSSRVGEIEAESRAHSILSHAVERLSTHASAVPLEPPPDGGAKAWTMAFASHLLVMNTWGFINSFGIFQAYYATVLRDAKPSTISWIGSTQISLLFLVGTLTGRLTDAGFFRPVFLLGSLLQLAGIFSSAQTSTYAGLLATQGICMGLANGFLFCPCITLLATYFQKRRSLAIGIAASGSATGGVVFPIIARTLLPRAGLPWTLRTIGFVQLVSLIVCNLLLRPRIPPRKSGPLIDMDAFGDKTYTFYAIGSFFLFEGLFFPFYYIASHATTQIHPPMSYPSSLNLLLLLNGAGAPGRLIPAYLADRFGTLTVLVPCSLSASLLVYAWPAVRSPSALWVWTALFGISGGGIQGLFPAALSSLTSDPRKQGTRIGMVFTIVSFSVLTGPPIDGAIIQATDNHYLGAQMFAGSCLLIGGCFIVAARWAKTRALGKGWTSKV
jgi:MFS family permease